MKKYVFFAQQKIIIQRTRLSVALHFRYSEMGLSLKKSLKININPIKNMNEDPARMLSTTIKYAILHLLEMKKN